jgi:hypothetical protein
LCDLGLQGELVLAQFLANSQIAKTPRAGMNARLDEPLFRQKPVSVEPIKDRFHPLRRRCFAGGRVRPGIRRVMRKRVDEQLSPKLCPALFTLSKQR